MAFALLKHWIIELNVENIIYGSNDATVCE
jgi:hypothetical protein